MFSSITVLLALLTHLTSFVHRRGAPASVVIPKVNQRTSMMNASSCLVCLCLVLTVTNCAVLLFRFLSQVPCFVEGNKVAANSVTQVNRWT
jgi:hypothetical protein